RPSRLVASVTTRAGRRVPTVAPSGGEKRPGAVGGSATAFTRNVAGSLQPPATFPSFARADQEKTVSSAKGAETVQVVSATPDSTPATEATSFPLGSRTRSS